MENYRASIKTVDIDWIKENQIMIIKFNAQFPKILAITGRKIILNFVANINDGR